LAEVLANRTENVFEWLDKAYARGDAGLSDAKIDSLMNIIRGDTRYAAFLSRMRLPL